MPPCPQVEPDDKLVMPPCPEDEDDQKLSLPYVEETGDMKGNMYQRAPYPETWIHNYGKGRVFYTSLGHREDVWTNPAFQGLLTGGIDFALGRVKEAVQSGRRIATLRREARAGIPLAFMSPGADSLAGTESDEAQ